MTERVESPSSSLVASFPGLDDLPDGVLVLSPNGDIEFANLVFLQMTSWKAEDVRGTPLSALVAEEDMLHLLGFEALFGGEPVQDGHVIFSTPMGSRCPLTVCSRRTSTGRVLLTTRGSSAVHRELEDASRWAASEQDRADELGRARDALEAKNAALCAAQEEIEHAYARLQNEVRVRERLEGELQLAQKLEAIGHLAAGIAHEINTPMQYIGDNVEFLRTAFERLVSHLSQVDTIASEHEPSRERLESARKKAKVDFLVAQIPGALDASHQGVGHVSRIVRAMKSFAHPDSDQKMRGDINQAIRDTLLVAQNEYKNVAIAETELGEIPLVACYVGRLNQVFLNLIVNAAHAVAEAKREELGKIRITSRVVGEVVEIGVEDNGTGIPVAVQSKIFDQFFTTKEVGRGTGQGLSLARRIVVDAHGGTLSFRTAIGVGSTFLIRLPVDGETKLTVSDPAQTLPSVSEASSRRSVPAI